MGIDITQLISKEIGPIAAMIIIVLLFLRQMQITSSENAKREDILRGEFNTRQKENFEQFERRLKDANETHERVMQLTALNYTANTERLVQSTEKQAVLMSNRMDEVIRINELTQTVVQAATLSRQIQTQHNKD